MFLSRIAHLSSCAGTTYTHLWDIFCNKIGFPFSISLIVFESIQSLTDNLVRLSVARTMEHSNKVLTSGPADPISSKVSRSKNLTVLSAEPAVCTTMKRVGEKTLLHPFSSFHNAKDTSIRGRLVRSNSLQAGNKCSFAPKPQAKLKYSKF
jgi:hypothetical protein